VSENGCPSIRGLLKEHVSQNADVTMILKAVKSKDT
jgi:hypothetical protein